MPPLGSAPRRRSPGVWVTRRGVALTPAQAAVWEGYFRKGRTDGRGHMTTPSVVVKQPAKPKPKATPARVIGKSSTVPLKQQTPSAKAGGPAAKNPGPPRFFHPSTTAQKRYDQHLEAQRSSPRFNPATQQSNVADAELAAQNPLNPVFNAVVSGIGNALDPVTPIVHAVRHHDLLAGGLAAAAIVPGGRVFKAGRVIEDAAKVAEGGRVVEKLPPVPPGHIRLWRGEGHPTPFVGRGTPDENAAYLQKRGRFFTEDRKTAESHAASKEGGHVTYVDVPEADVARYHDRWGWLEGDPREVVLPQEVVNRRLPVVSSKAAKGEQSVVPAATAAVHPADVIPNAAAEAGRQQVLGAMGDAKTIYAQQEALRKVERARRAALIGPAFEQAGGGVAGHAASTAALRGPMPALDFSNLKGMDDNTMNALLNAVHEHTMLQPFEKRNLRGALLKMQEGRVVTPSEVRLVHKAFGADQVLGPVATKKGVLDYVSDIINIPRSLMATGEFSYRLRNGLYALAMHPVGGVKTTGRALTTTFSQPRYEAMLRSLYADPEIRVGMDRGLEITETGPHVIGREEAFSSPLAETLTGGRFSLVRAAGRQFTMNADLDRAMIYKSYMDLARKTGTPIDDHLMDSAVRVANMATGRSGWGHAKVEMLTNTFLFAPKLFKTRLEAIGLTDVASLVAGKQHGFYRSLHPLVRRRIVGAMVRLVAAGMGTLALAAKYGAHVELDPRSSDWGKIRVGKTRYDVWGGNQQIARTIAQLAPTMHDGKWGQYTKSTAAGQIHKLGHGQHFDPLGRLFEGKLSPPVSFGLDVKRGEMFAGQPFTWKAEALQRFSPLLYQDIYDAWRMESPGMAGVVTGVGTFGVGTQTYRISKKSPLDKMIDRHLNSTVDVDKMIESYLNQVP